MITLWSAWLYNCGLVSCDVIRLLLPLRDLPTNNKHDAMFGNGNISRSGGFVFTCSLICISLVFVQVFMICCTCVFYCNVDPWTQQFYWFTINVGFDWFLSTPILSLNCEQLFIFLCVNRYFTFNSTVWWVIVTLSTIYTSFPTITSPRVAGCAGIHVVTQIVWWLPPR